MLSKSYKEDISVDYVISGTALNSGIDHNLSNGKLNISSGSLKATLELDGIIDDTVSEFTETIKSINKPKLCTFTAK